MADRPTKTTRISGTRIPARANVDGDDDIRFACIEWPAGADGADGWMAMGPNRASDAEARRDAEQFADRFGLDLVEER